MKIGITGHQHLGSEETITWLSDTIETIIKQHNIDMGFTSLAIGADQLFADILSKNQIPYTVIIPSDEYETTFTDPYHLEHYKILLQSAKNRINLPFDKPSENAFYEAGKKIVALSDLLIAIWDAQPAKGLGGTGDIVKYAQTLKRNVVHINPITRTMKSFQN